MKSIAFFLAVFSSLMVVLWLVVDRDSPAWKEQSTALMNEEPVPAADPRGNFIDVPIFDAEKERLIYEVSGYLDDSTDSLSFAGLDHGILHDGKLVVPIYDYENLVRWLPGAEPKGVSQFVFRFARAEYRNQTDSLVEGTRVIHLTGPGRGRSDDGTEIQFEDLVITIREVQFERAPAENAGGAPPGTPGSDPQETASRIRDKNIFKITSERPVRITNSLFTVESPSGVESELQGKDTLRHVFRPPVYTYLDAKTAQLFNLDMSPERPDAAGNPGSAPDRNGSERGKSLQGSQSGGGLTGRDDGLLAITSQGPLVLDRSEVPQTIEFRDDVVIYPTSRITPGIAPPGAPPEGDTWFHCQRLRMIVDSKKTPPISRAEATWPGGRVQASYRGFRFEGDMLTWNHLGLVGEEKKRLRSEAVLSGRPSFHGEWLQFNAREALLKFDEERIFLRGGVQGGFRLPPEVGDDKGEGEAVAAEAGRANGEKDNVADEPKRRPGLPQNWRFSADEAEIVVDPAVGRRGQAGRSKEQVRTPLLGGLRGISRFVARSTRDDGLLLESTAGETPAASCRLVGRMLTYEASESRVKLEGGNSSLPQFTHDETLGTAETMTLHLDENLLRFSDRVSLDLDLAQLTERPADRGEAGTPREDDPARALRIIGEQMDVRFDVQESEVRIRSAVARTMGRRPVTLEPLTSSEAGRYRLKGPLLHWDQEHETATMDAVDLGSEGRSALSRPSLEFTGGRLVAHRLVFQRDRSVPDTPPWVAKLEGGVEIEGSAARALGPTESDPATERVRMACERAEVEFFEDFSPLGQDHALFAELDRVRRVHGWGSTDRPLAIRSPEYSARGREVTWDAEVRQLRLFGGGAQEFRRHGSDVLRAEEIVYDRAEGLVQLRRNVRGQILLDSRLDRSETAPAAAGQGSSTEPPSPAAQERAARLLWTFETPSLDVRVRPGPDGRALELVSLLASDKVFLECASEGIQLHGDDLEYSHQLQEIRVFSRHGRYQTLLHTQAEDAPSGGESRLRTNKIDAREIRVWYRKEAAPLGTGQLATEHVVVRFYKDVTAAFHAPAAPASLVPSALKAAPDKELELWKLRANFLLLRVVTPGQGRPALTYAYAEGDVDFTSQDKRAMAQQVIYDEARNLLILKGDGKHPARLYYDNDERGHLKEDEIQLRQRGSTFELLFRKSRS